MTILKYDDIIRKVRLPRLPFFERSYAVPLSLTGSRFMMEGLLTCLLQVI